MLEWIDIKNIPEYLGGESKGTLVDDLGPWKNPELLRELAMEQSSIDEESEEESNKILSGSDFGDVVVEEPPSTSHKEAAPTEEGLFMNDPPKSSRSPLLPSTPDLASPTPSSPSAMSRTKALTGRRALY